MERYMLVNVQVWGPKEAMHGQYVHYLSSFVQDVGKLFGFMAEHIFDDVSETKGSLSVVMTLTPTILESGRDDGSISQFRFVYGDAIDSKLCSKWIS